MEGRAYPQRPEDKLPPLVETSARRLAIAEEIALAQWASGAPVEDAAREAQVIASATKAGESRGLDPAWVSNFFRAQIETNKLVQYSTARRLASLWQSAGSHACQLGQDDSTAARSAIKQQIPDC